jgi:hypothetical protein
MDKKGKGNRFLNVPLQYLLLLFLKPREMMKKIFKAQAPGCTNIYSGGPQFEFFKRLMNWCPN